MWLIGLCLLAAAALVDAEDQQQQQQQQQQQLAALGQPPAHVVYGLLVEPWLNASSRHRRRQLEPEQRQQRRLGVTAERAVRQQALVAAALLNGALERSEPVTVERLQQALAEYEAAPEDKQHRLLNTSLTELGERLHGPVIQLEALLIAQQTDLLSVSKSVAALREEANAHGAITRFVNSVTATVGRRVSAAEADISRLGDSLRQLNASVASGQCHRQGCYEEERQDSGGARTETGSESDSAEDEEKDLAGEVAQLRQQVADASSHCCDRLEARLARLEAAVTGQDQLASRLEATLARLQALEEQQALLLQQSGGRTGGAQLDLAAAGTEPRGVLLTGKDAVHPLSSQDGDGTEPPLAGDDRDRSGRLTESDIITADSLVTRGSDGRPTTVVLGRSIQVADSVGQPTRSGLPPQTPVNTGSSLHSLLLAGTPERPDRGGWRPVPAADGRSRQLPSAPDTAERVPAADGRSRQLPSAPDTAERVPAADGRSRQLPNAPDTAERVPAADGRSRQLPSAPGTAERVPAADGRSRQLPSAPGTAERVPAADGRSRRLPSAPGTARPTGTDSVSSVQAADGPTPDAADTAGTGGGDQRAEPSRLSPVSVVSPPQPGGAGVAARRGRPPVRSGRRLTPDPAAAAARGRPTWRGSSRLLGCRPTDRYSVLPGMRQWCLFNCPIYCPPSHCICQWAAK